MAGGGGGKEARWLRRRPDGQRLSLEMPNTDGQRPRFRDGRCGRVVPEFWRWLASPSNDWIVLVSGCSAVSIRPAQVGGGRQWGMRRRGG